MMPDRPTPLPLPSPRPPSHPRWVRLLAAVGVALLQGPVDLATAGTSAVPQAAAAGGQAPEAERALLAKALALAERGPRSSADAALVALGTHPLEPYLRLALLRRDPSPVAAEVERLLQANAGNPVAALVRDWWADTLAQRRDWPRLAALQADTDPLSLPAQRRCQLLEARLANAANAAERRAQLDAIEHTWLSGTSLPAACDPAFAALERAGRVGATLRVERIVLAAEAGQHGLMRHLADRLDDPLAARARLWAGFIEAPAAEASQWPRHPGNARVATAGLQQLARDDPDRAEHLLAALSAPLGMDAAAQVQVRKAIALWSAASYLPAAAARFAALPAQAFDAQLHEWRVREALARGDDAAALAAIGLMPSEQRADARWRYLTARLKERRGDAAGAAALLRPLAHEANWFGFLAADRAGQPYALCPSEPAGDRAAQARVRSDPALRRALLLFALDRPGWAGREWQHALAGFDDAERRLAVAAAVDAGWYDRVLSGLGGDGDQSLYALRFPLDHASHLRGAAQRQRLDPAWVAALIRAESAWMPGARSAADARGLMQLLPATGRQLARELGMTWTGAETLYQPLANISLGTRYLRAMLERFNDAPVVATAAYNAGPTPAARWLSQRPLVDADLWIETIPYRETREYVARVFAFSVIYDWRLAGTATPLSARLEGRTVADSARKSFACPAVAELAGDGLTSLAPDS